MSCFCLNLNLQIVQAAQLLTQNEHFRDVIEAFWPWYIPPYGFMLAGLLLYACLRRIVRKSGSTNWKNQRWYESAVYLRTSPCHLHTTSHTLLSDCSSVPETILQKVILCKRSWILSLHLPKTQLNRIPLYLSWISRV